MNRAKLLLGDLASAAYGLFGPGSGCRVLLYHAVGSRVPGDAQRIYSIRPEQFARHVGLLEERFSEQATDLVTAVGSASGLAITFDDGYHDTLTVAAPLLVAARLPFTVFVTRDLVEAGRAPYLTRAELRELGALPGVTIGAHGRTHRRMTECPQHELTEELAGTRAWLEDLLSRKVTTMSYPHGAVDARVRAAALDAGYTHAATSRFGTHRAGGDPLMVPRTDIWSRDGTRRLSAKARGQWDWMALRGG
jgi:peptidoglycan/xylan/chitin deacetylase (PgdA/CDA1 family)